MSSGKVQFSFPETKVLITGGTSGMGEACAIAFARAGANVVISGRNTARGKAIAQQATSLAGSIAFVGGDISHSEKCEKIVNSAIKTLGGLDVLVNSAGVIHHATAEQTTDEQWQQTMDVNVNGMFYMCRAAIPHLKAQGGVIVNIASDAGLSGSYHLVAYCASKGAVIQMSRAMALDLAADNIRVVPICPGDVDTPMLRGEFRDRGLTLENGLQESADAVPLKRVCSADEVADMVLYTASDSSRFVTGIPLVLDGGNRA